MYERDKALRTPYDEALSALIHEPTFRAVVGDARVTTARIIKDLGNRAVHDTRAVASQSAAIALRELFHFSYWLVRTYAKGTKPDAQLQFSVEALPRTAQVEAATLARLREIAKRFADQTKAHEEAEAKRTKRDACIGQQQAKLYADCLQRAYGHRPIIFYTNGYEHWIWDDASYPPRSVQGYLKKDELLLLQQRRSTRRSLASVEIDSGIAGRFYQARAIRRIDEAFEKDH
jgi:type I restriction enzyme R subunit